MVEESPREGCATMCRTAIFYLRTTVDRRDQRQQICIVDSSTSTVWLCETISHLHPCTLLCRRNAEMQEADFLSGPDGSLADRTLAILARVAETEEVRRDLDIRLFDLGILDSLATVELIIAFSNELGVEISPAELDREEWATPRKIVGYLERRVGA